MLKRNSSLIILCVGLFSISSIVCAMKRTLDDLYASGPNDIPVQNKAFSGRVHDSISVFFSSHEKRPCFICLSRKEPNEFFKFSCGQNDFCNTCLNEAIVAAVKSKNTLDLRCCDVRCRKPFEWEELQQFAQYEQLQTLDEIMLNEYLATHKDIKYCPNSKCSYAFIPSDQKCAVTCDKCKTNFCSLCLIDHYWITPCSVAQFLKSDDVSSDWIAHNTKPCPKCAMAIEHKGGCSSMECSRCGARFLW